MGPEVLSARLTISGHSMGWGRSVGINRVLPTYRCYLQGVIIESAKRACESGRPIVVDMMLAAAMTSEYDSDCQRLAEYSVNVICWSGVDMRWRYVSSFSFAALGWSRKGLGNRAAEFVVRASQDHRQVVRTGNVGSSGWGRHRAIAPFTKGLWVSLDSVSKTRGRPELRLG